MSTHLREKEERLRQILECLAEEAGKGTPIVVEGKKDLEALKALNINGRIISAKSGGKSLLDTVTEIETSGVQEIILLLDFDRRGKESTKYLKRQFERTRIKPDISFWHKLSNLLGREVKDIEGIVKYMETLKRKIGYSVI